MSEKNRNTGLIIVLILAILLMICAIILIIYKNTPGQQIKRQLSLGDKYLAETNYEDAILAFSLVLEIDPQSEEAYIGLVNSYIGFGDYEKALETVNRGIKVIGEKDELLVLMSDIEEKISSESDTVDEKNIEVEAAPIESVGDTSDEIEYNLSDYSAGDGDILETNVIYYDGYYFFTAGNDTRYSRKLIKYSDEDGAEETLMGCASQLCRINNIIYFTRSDSSGSPLTMCAYPLDGNTPVEDVSNGQVEYSFNVVSYDDNYIVYEYAQDEIITAYAAAGIYDGQKKGKFILVGYPGPVLAMKLYDGEIYYEGTDNEFDPTPDKWYKKYSLKDEAFSDITREDVPEDFPFSNIVEDVDLNTRERIETYRAITGEDSDPAAVYHDNIIYNMIEYVNGSFETTIKIYDYRGNFLAEIPCRKYIGCTNGHLLYVDYDDNAQLFEFPA